MGMTELRGLPKTYSIDAEIERARKQFADFINDIVMERVKQI